MLEATRKQKTIQATSSKSILQTMPGLICFKTKYCISNLENKG
jgi:hypothetical protein